VYYSINQTVSDEKRGTQLIECVLRVFELHTMRVIASLQLLGGSGLWILLVRITSAFSGKKDEKNYSSVR
jgi:hypothetical protein